MFSTVILMSDIKSKKNSSNLSLYQYICWCGVYWHPANSFSDSVCDGLAIVAVAFRCFCRCLNFHEQYWTFCIFAIAFLVIVLAMMILILFHQLGMRCQQFLQSLDSRQVGPAVVSDSRYQLLKGLVLAAVVAVIVMVVAVAIMADAVAPTAVLAIIRIIMITILLLFCPTCTDTNTGTSHIPQIPHCLRRAPQKSHHHVLRLVQIKEQPEKECYAFSASKRA